MTKVSKISVLQEAVRREMDALAVELEIGVISQYEYDNRKATLLAESDRQPSSSSCAEGRM